HARQQGGEARPDTVPNGGLLHVRESLEPPSGSRLRAGPALRARRGVEKAGESRRGAQVVEDSRGPGPSPPARELVESAPVGEAGPVAVVRARGLTKRFGGFTAVDSV